MSRMKQIETLVTMLEQKNFGDQSETTLLVVWLVFLTRTFVKIDAKGWKTYYLFLFFWYSGVMNSLFSVYGMVSKKELYFFFF